MRLMRGAMEVLGVAEVPQPCGGPCWFACRACGFNTGDGWGIMVHAVQRCSGRRRLQAVLAVKRAAAALSSLRLRAHP